MILRSTLAIGSLAAVLSSSYWPAIAAQIAPRPVVTPIQLGVSHEVKSNALLENRIVNVVLPAGYSKEPSRRYPVLYLIDGGVHQDLLHVAGVVQLGALWGRSAEAIVVGVETKDRRKELVGKTSDPDLLKRYPSAGLSANFREFIRAEVKPLIERSYRTSGLDVILGESLAGLFVAETYLVEPSLFDHYAAVDPSLWWDNEALARGSDAKVGRRQKGNSLFVAVAKEQLEDAAASKRLVSLLRAKQLDFCVVARPDLTHATIYQQVTPQAVQYLLPPPEAPSKEYGFSVSCADNF